MDKKHFELLLRHTTFSEKIWSELWDALDTMQRIELLLQLGDAPDKLIAKAIDDPNPVVRMLAVKDNHFYEEDEPDLYARLINDESPLVRAAMKTRDMIFEEDYLFGLSHDERLGVIALRKHFPTETFATFINEGLKNMKITEQEASELIWEFVRNPNLIDQITREPSDSYDWNYIRNGFEAMWNLTTSTQLEVHYAIATEYPTKTSHRFGDIPTEILDKMSDGTLSNLAFRQFGKLLEKLKEAPDKFDQSIHDSARGGAKFADYKKNSDSPNISTVIDELERLRAEVSELSKLINNAISRRKGLFG
ncbi:MAG: hypothetical protein Q8N30_10475 [Methylococcales bacterium]|nr:hypothetical protein [Methylococcales bacterium]